MSDILKGRGRDGDFVLDNQETAKEDGFAHVSQSWFNKTMTYDDCMEVLQEAYDKRDEFEAPLSAMTPIVNEDGQFVIAHDDGREFMPTDWAMKQLATRCFVPHTVVNDLRHDKLKPNGKTAFVRDDGDAALLVAYFKNGYRHHNANDKLKNKIYKWRAYEDGTLRAMLTQDYSPVDNRWYLELLRKLIPGGRLSHWRGDADTIFGNILIPDTIRKDYDGDYGGMISVGNCEIGKRRISQLPSVFRAICMNGCIWDQTKGKIISKVHKGIKLNELKIDIENNIQSQIPLLESGIDLLLGTRAFEISKDVSMSKVIAAVAQKHRFNTNEAIMTLSMFTQKEKSERNWFGVINSITRAGQEYSPETWYSFDSIAGELVNYDEKKFAAIIKRASSLDQKEVDKVYGLSA